jgi:YbbR domain-containing protein
VPGLAVAVRGDGIDTSHWTVTPAQVDVTLTGTMLSVEKARAALQPVVKVSGNDTKARDVDVTVEGLPPGIGVKISPERVRVGLGK